MYELAGYFVTAFSVLLFLTIAASFLIPMAFKRRITKIVAVIIVFTMWSYLYWDNIGRDRSIRDWRSDGERACFSDLASIPDSIAANSIADYGAALSKRTLLSLLSERNLSFVEVELKHNQPRLARGDGDHDVPWIGTPVSPTDRYAKIAIGRLGDSQCVSLPNDLNYSIQHPPFLPDSCLTVIYAAESIAEYSIQLDPPSNIDAREFGKWTLRESQTGKVVASLTTSDTQSLTMTSRGGLSGPKERSASDCRMPHRILVDRINKTIDKNSAGRKSQQVLVEEDVITEFDFGVAESYANGAPNKIYPAKIEKILFSKTKADMFRKRQSGDLSEWKRVVLDAKENGLSVYFDNILDWNERKISRIIVRSSKGHLSAFPDPEGFYVINNNDWYEKHNNLISRFSRDGKFIWSAWVATPDIRDRSCSVFWPEFVYATKNHVYFERACSELDEEMKKTTGKFYSGEKWQIEMPSNVKIN